VASTKSKKPRSDKEVLPASLVGELLAALPSQAPPRKRAAQLREQVLARVHREKLSADTAAVIATVRGASCAWLPLAPRVEKQPLFCDELMETFLIRMHPGAVIPAHDHVADEECFVIEGSYECDEMVVGRGDFQMSRAGSRHATISSALGCLLLLRRAIQPQVQRLP
jgi:anti-sigma factor ChrR (cupin superfamily)